MPTIPTYTKCASLGCKNEKTKLSAYCVEHGGRTTNPDKQERDGPYQTRAWKKIRTHQLSIQPLCQACLLDGRVASANHVDHVFPWRKIGGQSFKYNLFQSLCHEHHSHKTALEQQGIVIHYKDKPIQYSLNDYAYVLANS